jgi:hypothetical protein
MFGPPVIQPRAVPCDSLGVFVIHSP